MKIGDTLSYAIRHIMTRPRRSALSVLGIVISVVAIVLILSVSAGFREGLTGQLAAFGPDIMVVIPVTAAEEFIGGSFFKPPSSGKIFQEDVDDIDKIEGVKKTSRTVYQRAGVSFKDKNISTIVYGADTELFEQYGDYLEIESGRLYKKGDYRVAVIGADAATEFFGKDKMEVGSVFQIDEYNYRVIGILKKIGTSFSRTDDMAIFVPFDEGQEILEKYGVVGDVGYVTVQLEEGYDAEEIKAAIEKELEANRRKGAGGKDFSVVTSIQVLTVVSNILVVSELVLATVTFIAGLISGIGITNTMLVNVLERIREIGILKAVGATRVDIIALFIAESTMLGLGGGLLGILVGYWGIGLFEGFFGFPIVLTIEVVAYVSIFSFSTGVLAGVYPAYRASKLQPLNALRYV
jgi:putative ABC transport system permease protein